MDGMERDSKERERMSLPMGVGGRDLRISIHQGKERKEGREKKRASEQVKSRRHNSPDAL